MENHIVVLHSKFLELSVNPFKGARVQSIFSLRTKDEWIFYDESRKKEARGNELVYDDGWCGSFEELFPNDAPGTFDERDLQDHGELWNAEWEILNRSSDEIVMSYSCVTVPAVFTKRIFLHRVEPRVSIDYTLANREDKAFYYLFKLHPAMRIEEHDKILLPGGTIIRVDKDFSTIIGDGDGFRWPIINDKKGKPFDISSIPKRNTSSQEFIYVTDLPEGWCGLQRKSTGEEFVINFSTRDFPFCWFFMTYGGWKDLYTVVLEPCTNMPKDLEKAKLAGTCAYVKAHETKQYHIEIALQRSYSSALQK